MTTLNDRVEAIHRSLATESARYRELLRATTNAEAVEGSLTGDDTVAAKMIRDRATEMGDTEVVGAKLAAITKALHVVLRRYGASRKERREHVRG